MKDKEIVINLVKTENGYTVGNETANRIHYLTDSDEDRKKLINILIGEFINAEVDNGREYK